MGQRSREERLLEQLLDKTTEVSVDLDASRIQTGGKYVSSHASGRSITSGDIEAIAITATGESIVFPSVSGAGAVATGVPRVTLASDDPAVAKLGEIETTNNANQVLLTGIDADTNAMQVDLAAIEVLNTAINQKLGDIETAVQLQNIIGAVPSTAATGLGKAIQSAQGATDTGVAALVVRNDALADLSGADGDYAPLQVNATGALYVDVAAGGILESAVDGIDGLAAVNIGMSIDLAAMEVLLTAANVDHAANEALLTTIDADTNAIKTATEAIQTDAAAMEVLLGTIDADTNIIKLNIQSAVTDLAALEVLNTAGNADLAAMEVDLAALEVLSTAANVDLAAIEVLLTAANVDHAAIEQALDAIKDATENTEGEVTGLLRAEDSAHSSGHKGVMSLAVRNDALAPLAGADGDYAPMQVDAFGSLYTNNQFGTFGSILVTGTTATTCGVADRCFVAIYMLTNTVFNSSSGLVAETTQLYLDDTGTGTDIDADGGAAIDSITFPAGMTLYGRYTGFTLVSGSVVAYVG
tara:strand:- start:8556 stop:10139 length:1584 start_codon:yes stop_codon:yes gene_type:complete